MKCFARLSQQADAGKLKIADTKLPVPTGRSGGSAARGRAGQFAPWGPGPQWGPSRTDRAGRRDARCRSCSSRDQRTCAPGAMLKCFARLSQQADAGKLKIADTKLPVPTGRSGGSAARGRAGQFAPWGPGPQWGPSRTDRAGRRDARCRSCSSRDQRTCAPGAMLKCFARLSQQADAGKLKIADTKLPVPTGRSGGSAPRFAT